ncbi:uncharacterized protein A4U43_C01F9660 [Asparagus officinalis]|uniref:DYW domain-containing protein n=1 Tax=Asparagus officinalis TaxID=4686 RepID=A0A5P1FQP6_ASPOF|nr:uncharacterized protein A4U43_C01F9660 [Asparagus officinalis]
MNSGNLNAARKLFDEMPQLTTVSYNAIISGYNKCGQTQEPLTLLTQMHSSNTKLNETTFTSLLSACSRSSSFDLGKQIHSLILKSGFEGFSLVGSSLLNLYTSCFDISNAYRLFELLHCRNPLLWSLMVVGFVKSRMLDEALDLFDKMNVSSRDVYSWTSLISGCAQNDDDVQRRKALELFVSMTSNGDVKPNEFTYDSVLRACVKLEAVDFGRMIHGCLIRLGLEHDDSISGALVEFYCKLGYLDDTKRVFDQLDKNPCLNTCNLMIGSLVDVGNIREAEFIFNQLEEKNPVSYNLMIKGYADNGRIQESIALFDRMPCKNIVSYNTMISVYHKAGMFDKALKLFEFVKEENNTVTWNSMISGYVQNEQPTEAIKLYAVMQRSSIVCSRSTFSALFRACASMGTVSQGRMIHAQLIKTPFASNVFVGTSLVDMYAKCGSIDDSKLAFRVGERVAERMLGMDSMHVSVYVILSNIYARVGRWEKVREVREKLRGLRVKKDPGCSWIEAKDRVHVFCVEDRSHPESSEIFSVLGVLRDDVCSSCEFGFDPFVYDMHEHLVDSF